MDKAQRADLLRQRFRAKGGRPYVCRGLKPRIEPPKPGTFGLSPLGSLPVTANHHWLTVTPKMPAKPLIAPKRIKRASPLAKIAAAYPVRLPRRA